MMLLPVVSVVMVLTAIMLREDGSRLRVGVLRAVAVVGLGHNVRVTHVSFV